MRSRKAANEHVAQFALRRLELLTSELAQVSRTLPSGRVGGSPARENAPPARPSPQTESARRPLGVPRGGRHALRSVGFAGRVGGWIHDRLPPPLQGSVGLTSTHLTVVALVVAAAIGVAAWWAVRADGGEIVVPATSASMTDSATELVAVPEAETASSVADEGKPANDSAVVVVDVAGKVRRPGIVTLPIGSRVVDAIEAAGGARRAVNLTVVNLARLLVDGEQIVVGIPAPAGVAAPAVSLPGVGTAAVPAQLVNLNSATETDLDTLPGVGPVTAAAILEWRTENGAFTSVDELLEVSGIGDATLADIAPFVTI